MTKKKILLLAALAALAALLAIPAVVMGDATGTVTCTVTGTLVSVSVTDGTVNYGVLNLSTSKSTRELSPVDTQTATNNGTVAADFNIMSSNATRSGGITWTLSGTAGDNQYTHQFSTDNGTNWTNLTTSYQTLAYNIAVNGTQTFDLRIGMPTSTTDYEQHTITVTVQAVQHQ